MSDLKQRIAGLSLEQRALLERQMLEKVKPSAPISQRTMPGPCAPSFAQQRLWILQQLEPAVPRYNIHIAMRLRGPLQVEALRRAFETLIERHEVLRTALVDQGEALWQSVDAPQPFDLPVTDHSGLPEEEREAQAGELLLAESRYNFDLSQPLKLRAVLLRLSAQEHILSLTIHHVAFDGWSWEILVEELSALYSAYLAGEEPRLAEIPIQYADFAEWQRDQLQGEALERQLAFWKKTLENPSVLALPLDQARPAVPTAQGARITRILRRKLAEDLKALGQQEGATFFLVLLAAYKVLLFRYTGQEDLLVGVPVSNRTRVETEKLIGFFNNTLVLRSDLSGDPSFRELLGRVREVFLEASAHQEIPFEKLVEALNPARNLQHSPLFQTLFSVRSGPRKSLELPGLDVEPLSTYNGTTKYDLTVQILEREAGLIVTAEYSVDLFSAESIGRMLSSFETLLEGICAAPDQSISSISLLTTADRRQLLVNWNNTSTDFPRDASIPQLFEAQVERTPEAIAVRFGEQELSYRQLDQRSNQLAHYLLAHGVVHGSVVGLFMERSLDMLVAILGVVKAGAAYAPLDPAYPPERLATMLVDCSSPVLLTLRSLTSTLPPHPAENLCIDADWPVIANQPTESPACVLSATDPLYANFTSGSTGRPKSVLIPHRAVARLVCNTNYIQISPADHLAHLSSCSFDAATFEIWGALLNGARVVGAPLELILSPTDFAGWIETQAISVMFLTTSLFHHMASLVPAAFSRLRALLVGGEAIQPEWVRRVLQAGAPKTLMNVYGPTECTTFATYYPIQSVPEGASSLPIGRPVSNTQVYILDSRLEPVPMGVAGELYLGGEGLALGYLNRPELTAEKFVANPFASDSRLYRTGDLARYRLDGNIEFLGRIDQQVKIRGFRVELDEIETWLCHHPTVRQASVILRRRKTGEPYLAAYLVPEDREVPDPSTLREFLKQKLPAYMVPSAYLLMDNLPLNPNGKIDREKLPLPPESGLEEDAEFVAARDGLESTLVKIWEEVLGVTPIGIHHNFFDLGGHSLLAIHLFTRIEQVLGKKLPATRIFNSPTIAQLAGLLKEEHLPDWSPVVPIQLEGSKPPFFCVHGFGGGVVGYAPLARFLSKDQPFYGLQAKGSDGTAQPHSQVEEMAAYYVEALRKVQPHGPYYLGGYCYGGIVAYEMACQLESQGERAALVAIFEGYAPPGREGISPGWDLSGAIYFLRNIPAWWREFYGMGYRQMLATVLSKARIYGKRVARKLGLSIGSNLKDLVIHDIATVPEAQRKIMEVHLQAMRRYRAKPYSGKVTLFRVRRLSLLRGHDPYMGWRRLAGGGVEVRMVDGTHYSVVEGENVASLAEQLQAALDDEQAKGERP